MVTCDNYMVRADILFQFFPYCREALSLHPNTDNVWVCLLCIVRIRWCRCLCVMCVCDICAITMGLLLWKCGRQWSLRDKRRINFSISVAIIYLVVCVLAVHTLYRVCVCAYVYEYVRFTKLNDSFYNSKPIYCCCCCHCCSLLHMIISIKQWYVITSSTTNPNVASKHSLQPKI